MRIKKKLTLIAFLIMAINSWGQDTIYLRSDQRIACKILEVSPTEVKYKKAELSDGPLYIENKSAILQIKYSNGFIDVFPQISPLPITKENNQKEQNTGGKKYLDLATIQGERTIYLYDGRPMGERDMHDLLLSLKNPKITEEVNLATRSQKFSYIGFLTIPFGVAGAVCGVNALGVGTFSPYHDNARKEYATLSAVLFSAAAFSLGTTIYFDTKSRNANRNAIRLYRQTYLTQ